MKFSSLLILLLSASSLSAQKAELKYTLSPDSARANVYQVDAELINTGTQDLYILVESCNTLDYMLSTTHDSVAIYITFHCYASYPEKIKIEAQAAYKFRSYIKANSGEEAFQLQLELYPLPADIEARDFRLIDLKKKFAPNQKLIIGPKVSLP